MAARKKDEIPTVRYTIDGKSYDLQISLEKIPLRERIEVEEYMGMPWVEAMDSWFSSEKLQAFLAYIAMRRRRPTATLADVLDAKELEADFDPEERPTKAASAKTGSQS